MNTAWVSDPVTAYYDWQLREAAGADRRPFSRQSIAQHCAMFDRFLRHLVGHGETLASFGPDHVDAFWQTEGAKEYGPATRMRYLKLIDRLCRHLVSIGLRRSNPADEMVRAGRWPDGDPDPIYLPLAADLRLQAHVAPVDSDNIARLRARAIVALLLGTGITAAECRHAMLSDLQLCASPPYLHVPARGARDARTVRLPAFAVPVLELWSATRPTLAFASGLLFTARPQGSPLTDMSLGKIVRGALHAIDFEAADMSPRILRNTFCRRQLTAGVSPNEVSARMGLASRRTCDRMLATIRDEACPPPD